MDDELYQAFITESEESITQLNNSLLELESNPDDQAAIDDIFRRAHTLKGNFGAMGFDDAATVAHAVEDLLDAVRQGHLEVTPERMDLVFDGVDLILDILHDIEETGESTVDPSDTVVALREAAEDGDDTAETAASDDAADDVVAGDSGGTAGGGDGPAAGDGEAVGDGTDTADVAADGEAAGDDGSGSAGDRAAAGDAEGGPATDSLVDRAREVAVGDVDEALAAGDYLHHVDVTLDSGEMKSVDAGLFVGGIPDAVAVLASYPSLDDVEAGNYDDDGFELWVSGLAVEETAETFADLWAVQEALVTELTGRTGGSAGGDGHRTGPADGDEADSEATGPVEPTPEEAGHGSEEPVEGERHPETGGPPPEAGDGSPGADEDASAKRDDDGAERSISAVKSVRVDVDQLDELHELVEQLVTSRIKLRQAIDGGEATGLDTLDELDKISSNLQNTVMDMRLIPLKKVFDKFPRLVRDLARSQDKRVNFTVEGQDIELDRTILDEISDPLMHVLRNAVDHGIEPPEEREAAGKPRAGTVELTAEREHDTVVITVEDDGGGIDVEAVKDKAVSQGVATRAELDALPDTDVFDYVFHPGFSTNDEITDVSGRGVGMDVVKTTVEALDGSVSVDSEPGSGSVFTIRLPVSVAIIKVLFVQVGERQFGVPIKYIDEVSPQNGVEHINGVEVVVHDDLIYPLIRLRDALGIDPVTDEGGMVVRIRPADRQVALRCDNVTRQEEVVVTPLQGPLSGADGLSGTAVIGDGNVIPILDIGTLDVPEGGRRVMHQSPPAAGAGEEGAAD